MARLLVTLMTCLLAVAAEGASNLELGESAFQRGEFEEAIERYTQALSVTSVTSIERARAHHARGVVFNALGDFRRAIAEFDQALQLQPESGHSLYRRGIAQYQQGEFARAEEDLDGALERQPDDAYRAIWMYLAKALNGRDARAELAEHVMALDLGQWPGPLVEYFLGVDDLRHVVDAAHDGDYERTVTRTCEAAHYVGQDLLARGHPQQARNWFDTALAACHRTSVEHAASRAALDGFDVQGELPSRVGPDIAQEVVSARAVDYEVTESVNYRKGPGTEHPRIGVLPPGSRVVVEGNTGEWAHVTIGDDTRAFVHRDYLQLVEEAIEIVSNPEFRDHVTTARVNYRVGPGTGFRRLGTLESGTAVRVDGAEGEWRRVQIDGAEAAFVHKDFLRETGIADER